MTRINTRVHDIIVLIPLPLLDCLHGFTNHRSKRVRPMITLVVLLFRRGLTCARLNSLPPTYIYRPFNVWNSRKPAHRERKLPPPLRFPLSLSPPPSSDLSRGGPPPTCRWIVQVKVWLLSHHVLGKNSFFFKSMRARKVTVEEWKDRITYHMLNGVSRGKRGRNSTRDRKLGIYVLQVERCVCGARCILIRHGVEQSVSFEEANHVERDGS